MADFTNARTETVNGISFKVVDGSNLPTPATHEAPTKGIGFHQFDGNTPVDEVVRQIGADFTVEKQHLCRIPNDVFERIMQAGEDGILVHPKDIIDSHMATVCAERDKTIGVVGSDYGVIQNCEALDILNVITNSDVTGQDMRIVSAGLVHDFEPYVQVSLPQGGRINGDNSDTEYYCFMHTSHDGSSSLKVSFSAIRVVCSNTFMANMRSVGFALRHTSGAGGRVDMTQEANVKRVQEFVRQTQVFREDYIERMNVLASKDINTAELNEFITRAFIPADQQEIVRKANYMWDGIKDVSTRAKNQIAAFRNVLESGQGQDTNRGTRLWLFNGLTNYYSNVANYGSTKDDAKTAATKRFDSLSSGNAMRKSNEALQYLLVG